MSPVTGMSVVVGHVSALLKIDIEAATGSSVPTFQVGTVAYWETIKSRYCNRGSFGRKSRARGHFIGVQLQLSTASAGSKATCRVSWSWRLGKVRKPRKGQDFLALSRLNHPLGSDGHRTDA